MPSINAEAAVYDVYGFRFRLRADGPTPALADLANDFSFFRADAGTGDAMEIDLHIGDPPYEGVPPREASVYTPRNIAFSEGSRTYIDYGCRALAIHDRAAPAFQMYSRDHDLLYEATYLFLISRIGEFLDARRLHRIHAMALSLNGRAVLAILPMGGGKSTLTAELLKQPDFHFLSDDSPFIARDGSLRAFPLRLGLLPGGENDVPPEYRRSINRMEFGPKFLVTYDYFGSRVEPTAKPGIVFLGYRSLAPVCRIEPAGRLESYRVMVTDCVVGLGLFQGLEFVLRSNPLELMGKARVGFSRLRNARALFRRSKVYRLILGRDREQNAQAVAELVRKELG